MKNETVQQTTPTLLDHLKQVYIYQCISWLSMELLNVCGQIACWIPGRRLMAPSSHITPNQQDWYLVMLFPQDIG